MNLEQFKTNLQKRVDDISLRTEIVRTFSRIYSRGGNREIRDELDLLGGFFYPARYSLMLTTAIDLAALFNKSEERSIHTYIGKLNCEKLKSEFDTELSNKETSIGKIRKFRDKSVHWDAKFFDNSNLASETLSFPFSDVDDLIELAKRILGGESIDWLSTDTGSGDFEWLIRMLIGYRILFNALDQHPDRMNLLQRLNNVPRPMATESEIL